MHPLNPFLRAFFSSKLPAQCNPPSSYILFIPTTEHLLTHKELETQTSWSELVSSEEILASHVVRVPGGSGSLFNTKDGPSLRDGKGKAKQFPTLNGRTVVIKDNFIYSNKGFKTLNQAQLIQDYLYYPDQLDASQWIVIFISRPLVGTPQPLLPSIPPLATPAASTDDAAAARDQPEIKGFNDLLNHFPVIARQMQPGLEQLFQQFMAEISEEGIRQTQSPTKDSSKAAEPTRPASRRSTGSFSSATTVDGAQSLKSSLANAGPVETGLRSALETLVFGAIALFQTVDKHQLTLLSASTDLSSLTIERMIERYVTEHFHTRILFPQIRSSRVADDHHLESAIRYMGDLDISQVGASLDGGQAERRELNLRLAKGVDAFKRMSAATSPQEMVEALLDTARAITTPISTADSEADSGKEKLSTVILTNADLLVSMLLIVVVRSPIRHLYARLGYMVGFIFTDEVETGEVGYALSTFEAVLSYLSTHSSGLKRASQANKSIRRDVRKGNLPGVRRVLDQDGSFVHADGRIIVDGSAIPQLQDTVVNWMNGNGTANGHAISPTGIHPGANTSDPDGLSHVFPFQTNQSDAVQPRPKLKKRVSLSTEVRSRSSSSAHSITSTSPSALSRSSTMRSAVSYNVKDETSAERLCSSQDTEGNSLLMIAVESTAPRVLDYLLDRSDLFPLQIILGDCNNDGATLLNTAMKIGDITVIDILVEFITSQVAGCELNDHLGRQDGNGRSAAHYLFNAPHLIARLAHAIPWDLRDKNGQTPLFALCRSYDHENYINMVEMALHAACDKQGDGEPLHLDRHADGKMNTLLHIANDHKLVRTLLRECDVDPNAKNEKQFTPLMVASKFARLDTVRLLFHDTRTDLLVRESRGFTAVELAKDDDVRNRIDDLVLLTHAPGGEGRVTMIVRSYFVEDGTIRMILKSGASNSRDTVMVTTCRRSLTDFEALTRWLAMEHPASWIPAVTNFRSPFQLPFRPSRVVLRDTQLRLDAFLKTMLAHPTFATHEMLWEFFLVPDVDPSQLSARAHLKSDIRKENLRLEYSPIPLDAVSSVELFIDHATDQIRAVHYATQDVLRHINAIRNRSLDLTDAHSIMLSRLNALTFIPPDHQAAMKRHAQAVASMQFAVESSPMTTLHYQMANTISTTNALLSALNRPATLISKMRNAAEQVSKHEGAAARSAKWPSALGLLDDARRRLLDDSFGKADKAQAELDDLGRELAYTQSTVAAELAGWWEMRGGQASTRRSPHIALASNAMRQKHAEGTVKAGLREFARGMVIREKERLERLRRAGRLVGVDVFKPRRRGPNDSISLDTGALPHAVSKGGPLTPGTPAARGTTASSEDDVAVDELIGGDSDGEADGTATAEEAIREAEANSVEVEGDMIRLGTEAVAAMADQGTLSADPAGDDEPQLTDDGEERPLLGTEEQTQVEDEDDDG